MLEKRLVINYLRLLFERDSFYSPKYGESRCVSVEDWFSEGLRDNIVGEILEKIESGELDIREKTCSIESE